VVEEAHTIRDHQKEQLAADPAAAETAPTLETMLADRELLDKVSLVLQVTVVPLILAAAAAAQGAQAGARQVLAETVAQAYQALLRVRL
jgi:hypothetical protein